VSSPTASQPTKAPVATTVSPTGVLTSAPVVSQRTSQSMTALVV
jgi:hypothetical protein